MQTTIKRTMMAITLGSSLAFSGCGDLVVKVEKKPKNVDLSALENIEALNLQDSENFLQNLDDLKVIGVDLLIKEMNRRNYRSEVRSAIRKYRTFLIERASRDYKIDEPFYASGDECRDTGLSFNMEDANGFLGLILKTAVLSKLSEVNAGKINPGLSKEIAAIGQLVLMELGLKVEGDVNVEKTEDERTITSGTVKIWLEPISDEDVSEQMKIEDQKEVMTMTFSRDLGKHYIGTFDTTIEVIDYIDEATSTTYEGMLAVERVQTDGRFIHTLAFDAGVKDGETAYSRAMAFEQVDGAKHQLKVTDTIWPGTDKELKQSTVIDVQEGTQCKLDLSEDWTDQLGETGDESGFTDAGEETGDDSTDTDTDSDTDDGGSDDEGTTDEGSDDESTDGDTTGSDDDYEGDNPDDYKGDDDKGDEPKDDEPTDDDKDYDEPGKDDDGNDPGQNPGQTPHQG